MSELEQELVLPVFGSQARILVGGSSSSLSDRQIAAVTCAATMRRMHSALTRFEPASELSRLNRDPRETIAVSPILMAMLQAGVDAAELTAGLADPTLLPSLVEAGYGRSRVGLTPTPLEDALESAPPRAPARPAAGARWNQIVLDPARMTVTRPPGLPIDPGGVAKGLAADICSRQLRGFGVFAVDCAGDMRLGGVDGLERAVIVADPFGGKPVLRSTLAEGAVATSGISSRVWRHGESSAHHLIDPARGRPAWTGIVQCTAIAPTAVEAEARAKAGLLSGPEGAGAWLEPWGGAYVEDDGSVVRVDRTPAAVA